MNFLRALLIGLLVWLQTVPAFTASRFWVGGTGTWDASDTTHWSASSGGAGGQSVPTTTDTATLDAASGGGTVTVNTNFTVQTATIGAFTGTLDFATNNNSPTFTASFSCTGTGTRTLNMGNGTWTVSSVTGTVWDCGTITNLTFNANSSTLSFAATPTSSRTINFGNLTYNIVNIINASLSSRVVVLSVGAPTFSGVVTLTNMTNLRLSAPQTYTFNGGLSYSGTSSSQVSLSTDAAATPAATVSVAGAVTLNWAYLQNITKAGAGSIAATNSFDGGGNTGVIFGLPGGARCIGC